MEGGNILWGVFAYIRHCPIPFWVTSPHDAVIPTSSVYVRVSNGGGLIAFLEPFSHNRTASIHGDRAFVRVANNEILTAFLMPEDVPVDQYRAPRLYVRMPNHNYTLYAAALLHIDGHRPDWLH